MSKSFVLKILSETEPTSDNRQFEQGTVTWREPPLPLIATRTNGEGHKGATTIGAIHDVWRHEGSIFGRGEFADDATADEFLPLIESGALNGVSADVVGAKIELEAQFNDDGSTRPALQRIHGGEIAGVTVLPIPAFADTRILVASAAPVKPPLGWFANPNLTQVTPMTVTAEGQVFGHLAAWNSCHLGYPTDQCMLAPKSRTDYAYFATGQVFTAEGPKVATGVITMATGHAGITLGANEAKEHYDHTGFGVADVACGEDAFGIWFAGALRPDVEPEKIRQFAASGVSGDWRTIEGNLDMVGLLAVNTPGFGIPRTKACLAEDQQFALVAAGYVDAVTAAACCEDCANKDKKDDDKEEFDAEAAANMVAVLRARVSLGIGEFATQRGR